MDRKVGDERGGEEKGETRREESEWQRSKTSDEVIRRRYVLNGVRGQTKSRVKTGDGLDERFIESRKRRILRIGDVRDERRRTGKVFGMWWRAREEEGTIIREEAADSDSRCCSCHGRKGV